MGAVDLPDAHPSEMYNGGMTGLDRPVREATVAVVDVETTGLWAEQGDRVCEIAVLRLEAGAQVAAFSSLVNPCRPIHPDASRVNGLADGDVVDAPVFADLAHEVDRLLEGAVMVAHNAPFDGSFLVAEYTIAGREPPDVPVLDTLALSRRLFRFRRNDLGSVAEALGARGGVQHRAARDAEVTYQVLLRMADQLAPRGIVTVQDLLAAQGEPFALRSPRLNGLPAPLSAAVRERHPVTICYIDRGGRASERVVVPLWANHNYLIAFCRLRKEQRTFRLDRIVDAWLS